MEKFPLNTTKVPLKTKCDICQDKLAGYYNSNWYIHFCSLKCFESFLKGYYKEIDDIALEIKNADDLKEEDSDEI